jgi:hypothetical protein
MTKSAHDTWTFTVQLPAGVPNPGRYMAAVLKWIWRRWGVKATAVIDGPKPSARPAPASLQGTVEMAAAECEVLKAKLERHSSE